MFRRIRQLNISLAAKCQLLFGAAVVLIILAALYVPWQRMEQLMEQVNVVAARTVAQTALSDHIARAAAMQKPATTQPGVSTTVTTAPVDQPAIGNTSLAATTQPADTAAARIVSAWADRDGLTAFDRRAFDYFKASPDAESFTRYYERHDNSTGYRFALPLFASEDCLSCHSTQTNRATASTSQPTTAMAGTAPPSPNADALFAAHANDFLGILSIDMKSGIDNADLLLNRVFILTAGMIAGTLAIVVFYLITTRLILQPVRVLQETAEKVSEGDLNIRSDISTGDEFQQLSETFNTMLSNLKSNADELSATNKALDIKLGQLSETNVALFESNRLKSEFLANVSHELRTPLNSILGFTELLKETSTPDAKSTRYIQNIFRSGRNLLDLINDLLDLAKIEAGKMEVRTEPLSLPDLFEGLNGLLKPLLAGRDLTIAGRVNPLNGLPILHTDPAKLQQVLYNFLSNAIKFSPPNGQIELEADRDNDDHVRIAVTDHGIGIEPDKHDVIFEKFRQLDGSVTREYSGTGLGLAIAKEMTQLLGGRIGVRSATGEGSTFWISLPLQVPLAADVDSKVSLT